MNQIQRLIVRAKHWQVFLLLFGLFFLGNVVGFWSMTRGSEEAFKVLSPILALTELLGVCFCLWLWCLGLFLTSLLDEQRRLNYQLFQFTTIYPPLYMLLFIVVFPRLNLNPGLLLMIFPLHTLATFCLLYDFYFVSKSLASVEKARRASFPDYVGYFLALWVFPVGIWIVQPRVNRLYSDAFDHTTA
jgi:hypothetical protein